MIQLKLMSEGMKMLMAALTVVLIIGIGWYFVHNYRTGQIAKDSLNDFKEANEDRRETSGQINDSYGVLRSDGLADSTQSDQAIDHHREGTRRVANEYPEVDAELNRPIPQQLLDADRKVREAAKPD